MNTEAIQREVRALEDRRYQATIDADAARLEELLGDGLVYTHSTGRVETKAEFISAATTGIKYQKFERPQETIQIYGDTAVITGEATIQVMVRGAAAPTHLHVRHLNVWVQVANRWQMVAWESTRIG